MILTIDIGNSRLKWVLFSDTVITRQGVFSYSIDTFIEQLSRANFPLNADKIVISSVAGADVKKMLSSFLSNAGCCNYQYATTQKEQCGLTNSYRDYSTLGVDRWLAMIAGYGYSGRKQGQAICVIDCGTAMTLDVVDAKGCHMGGVIAPGYKLMTSMLNKSASNIKVKADVAECKKKWLSDTTVDAVSQGCAMLFIGGINSMLKQCIAEQGAVYCIVTGGDAGWVAEALDSGVVCDPLLVNKGLLQIAFDG